MDRQQLESIMARIQQAISSAVCRYGLAAAPDSISGVEINGITYPVFIRNGGGLAYVDGNGVVRDVPAGSTFVNLNEINWKQIVPFDEYYKSNDGVIRLKGVRMYNGLMEVIKADLHVIESNIATIPVGTHYTAIPNGFTITSSEKILIPYDAQS